MARKSRWACARPTGVATLRQEDRSGPARGGRGYALAIYANLPGWALLILVALAGLGLSQCYPRDGGHCAAKESRSQPPKRLASGDCTSGQPLGQLVEGAFSICVEALTFAHLVHPPRRRSGLTGPVVLANATTLASGDELAMNSWQTSEILIRGSSENSSSRTFVHKGKKKGQGC